MSIANPNIVHVLQVRVRKQIQRLVQNYQIYVQAKMLILKSVFFWPAKKLISVYKYLMAYIKKKIVHYLNSPMQFVFRSYHQTCNNVIDKLHTKLQTSYKCVKLSSFSKNSQSHLQRGGDRDINLYICQEKGITLLLGSTIYKLCAIHKDVLSKRD